MPRARKWEITAEEYRGLGEEAHVLATLKQYAERWGGFTRHVHRAEGQDLEGVQDCLIWLPAHDPARVCLGLVEIKIRDDGVSAAQWAVHRASRRIDRIVPAILREGAPPRAGELSLDGVLARLEDARRRP